MFGLLIVECFACYCPMSPPEYLCRKRDAMESHEAIIMALFCLCDELCVT
jgi:hypothetical protein